MRRSRRWLIVGAVAAAAVAAGLWLRPVPGPAPAARPDDTTRVYLITRDGKVQWAIEDFEMTAVLENEVQIRTYFRRRAEEDARIAGGGAGAPPPTAIVFEVEGGTPREVIDGVLAAARGAGFRRVTLRV